MAASATELGGVQAWDTTADRLSKHRAALRGSLWSSMSTRPCRHVTAPPNTSGAAAATLMALLGRHVCRSGGVYGESGEEAIVVVVVVVELVVVGRSIKPLA